MAAMRADIALLTERRYEASAAAEGDWYLDNVLRDDQLLQAALERLGLSSIRIDWARPNVDWTEFLGVVFRTTWDYFDRLPEFSGWLDTLPAGTRLCNDLATVRWNMDKHYLADLEANEIAVVPSRFIERGSDVSLPGLLAETGWMEAVIKPCVSGAARHTYRVNTLNANAVDPIVRRLLADEALILQPFQQEVMRSGEDSLMVFEGRYSHAVRKLPKSGDFRVQDDHGGTAHPCQATADQIELAERAIAACRRAPAYGRVDLVRDEQGRLVVMELELIEPELWLRNHPPAASTFAQAIVRFIELS